MPTKRKIEFNQRDYEEDLTAETLPEDTLEESADVEVTVSPSKALELTLTELNALLGKDFKDKETALKAVKDTFSYVGKKREDIVKELGGNTENLSNELKQIKENLFYKDNPQFAQHRDLISKLGSNPEEVVSMPSFKSIFEKADGYDKSQQLRSVLTSNPRLASSKDNLSKAVEARNTGDRESMEKHATQAVLDTLNL